MAKLKGRTAKAMERAKARKAKAAPRKKARAKPLARTRAPKVTKVDAPPAGEAMTVPLASVFVAKENPRHGQAVENLQEITASLKSHTQLQDVICYKVGERFAATDGARRLAGLDAGGAGTVKIVVYPKERAIELGVAAQVERVNLHAADEAVTFARMLKGGDKLAQVAGAFGKTERYVLQRQKLAGLHPPILAALRKDEISIDKASAWANVSEDRQPSIWKRIGRHASIWQIRDASEDGRIGSTERLAQFVGEEAYLAAGGQPESKLFKFEDEDADATWDQKLVDKLAADKVEALKEKYLAEGWGWVEFAENGKPYDVEKHPKPAKTDEDRKARGVYLSLGKTGQISAEKNLVSRKAAEAAKKKAVKAKPGKGGATAEVEEEDSAPPMTGRAHEALTRMAGVIVGRSIRPSLGVPILLAAVARLVFNPAKYGSPIAVLALKIDRPRGGELLDLVADEAFDKEVDRWRKFTIEHWNNLESAILNLARPDQDELAACLAAGLIDTVEFNVNQGWGGDRRLLSRIGTLAETMPAAQWKPGVDFLKGLSKSELARACAELGIEPLATKGKTAEAVSIAAKAKSWVPQLMRQLTGAEDPPPETEKERLEDAEFRDEIDLEEEEGDDE